MKQKIKLIVGMQFGDEGKGKITNFYSDKVKAVCRFQGGNNAGHTIKFDGETHKLHLVPSGIFNKKVKNFILSGVVVDLAQLNKEIKTLNEKGYTVDNLYISGEAHIIMPYHILLDEIYEEKRIKKIGTTKRGIGPCYADKMNRDGIRIIDLLSPEVVSERIKNSLNCKMDLFRDLDPERIPTQEKMEEYIFSNSETLIPLICSNTRGELSKAPTILFEGAQGLMLCLEHGNYPFVSSSSSTIGNALHVSGIGPSEYKSFSVLGICKSYTSRVGEGYFPTEINGDLADLIRKKGNEFGTTTGRPRRVGWLDLVALKHARDYGGVTEMCITLLDVLSDLEEIKICTHYINEKGEKIDYIPESDQEYRKCKPHYFSMKPWRGDISKAKSLNDLPQECLDYIEYIENQSGVRVSLVSVGPEKDQTIKV